MINETIISANASRSLLTAGETLDRQIKSRISGYTLRTAMHKTLNKKAELLKLTRSANIYLREFQFITLGYTISRLFS